MLKKILKWTVRILLILIVAVFIYGTIWQSNYDSNVEKEYPPTGQFSDIGTNKIHFKFTGEGPTTFVLIAGLGETMHTWSSISEELNKRGRVFMYDRSGLGHSEEGVYPRSVDNVATELKIVLDNEKIPGPYVIIGHSAGGFVARYYANKYPEDVLGLMMIDPFTGDVARKEATNTTIGYKVMSWVFRNLSWSGIPFYLLPKTPPHPIYKTSKGTKTYASEGHAVSISLEEFAEIDKSNADVPLYFLQADKKKNPYNEIQQEWSRQVFDKYSNSSNRYFLIESGHHIHIDKPEAVLDALDEFVSVLIQ